MRRFRGFTLIELLVVILILAILMAIALPLYLRAVRDSEKQTCRSNMQTIANAAQAWKVRSADHGWPASYGQLFTDPDPAVTAGPSDVDLITPGPQCPAGLAATTVDYVITDGDSNGADGSIIITCADAAVGTFHNDVGATVDGFIPGMSNK